MASKTTNTKKAATAIKTTAKADTKKATTATKTTAKADTKKAATTTKTTTKADTKKTATTKKADTKKTTTKTDSKKTDTTKKTTTKTGGTVGGTNNLNTKQIDAWATSLKTNIRSFKEQADIAEDCVQNMAKYVKSENNAELHQALLDLKSLLEVTHRQLGNFYNQLSTSLSKYTKDLGIVHDTIYNKFKGQDQFKENATKISKFKLS